MFYRILLTAITVSMLAFTSAASADQLATSGIHKSTFEQAEAALARDDAERALTLLERIEMPIRRDGDVARHAGLRCIAFHQLGLMADAEAACTDAIRTRAVAWSDYNNRGAARLAMGDTRGALLDLRRANQMRPGQVAVRKNLARAIKRDQNQAQLAQTQ